MLLAPIASYTHGPGIDDPVIMNYDGSDYFFHKNHLGSITEITDIYQNTVKTYDYDAFGAILAESGTLDHNAFTYTGREYHSRSGLYYYRARFYDPAIGRFITPDPIGHFGGTNLYAYVGNAPAMFVDPLGLEPWGRIIWGGTQYWKHQKWWKGEDLCNEFVVEAHISGDPDVKDFPEGCGRRRLIFGPRYPLVRDLANPNFAPDRLEYLPIEQAQQGDIIVWYDGVHHHSAIYIGHGRVVYQNAAEGVKRNTVEAVTKSMGNVSPIIRRYIYP